MRQLHDMGTTITYLLNRGFAPSRMACPTLAGRQKPEVSDLCHKEVTLSLDKSRTTRRQASAFLLD